MDGLTDPSVRGDWWIILGSNEQAVIFRGDDKKIEPREEKINDVVSEQVRHKMTCTSLEDGWRLETLE